MPDGPLNWLDPDPVENPTPGPRFALAGEEDGSWTVIDQLTGMPAVFNDKMLFSLPFDQADDLVETMNLLALDPNRR